MDAHCLRKGLGLCLLCGSQSLEGAKRHKRSDAMLERLRICLACTRINQIRERRRHIVQKQQWYSSAVLRTAVAHAADHLLQLPYPLQKSLSLQRHDVTDDDFSVVGQECDSENDTGALQWRLLLWRMLQTTFYSCLIPSHLGFRVCETLVSFCRRAQGAGAEVLEGGGTWWRRERGLAQVFAAQHDAEPLLHDCTRRQPVIRAPD